MERKTTEAIALGKSFWISPQQQLYYLFVSPPDASSFGRIPVVMTLPGKLDLTLKSFLCRLAFAQTMKWETTEPITRPNSKRMPTQQPLHSMNRSSATNSAMQRQPTILVRSTVSLFVPLFVLNHEKSEYIDGPATVSCRKVKRQP
jgi:hypothetical protein